jgi:hypothetical protein
MHDRRCARAGGSCRPSGRDSDSRSSRASAKLAPARFSGPCRMRSRDALPRMRIRAENDHWIPTKPIRHTTASSLSSSRSKWRVRRPPTVEPVPGPARGSTDADEPVPRRAAEPRPAAGAGCCPDQAGRRRKRSCASSDAYASEACIAQSNHHFRIHRVALHVDVVQPDRRAGDRVSLYVS